MENMPAEEAHHDRDERHGQHRPQGEPRINSNHEAQTEDDHHRGVDDGERAKSHEFAYRLNVIGKARHKIAGLGVLKIAERKLLQMGENAIPQVRFAPTRKTVNIDPPAVAE